MGSGPPSMFHPCDLPLPFPLPLFSTMRPPANTTRDYGDPMTPMIDVVFNLLIFFVVTAVGRLPSSCSRRNCLRRGLSWLRLSEKRDSWATDVWLKLSLGESDALQVDMNGTVYRDLAQLKANLRALAEVGPESPVVLDIAPSVQMEQLVDVWDTCIAAGFQSVSFAVDAAAVAPAGPIL